MLPSYRNQSIDLLCKSIDLFLYEDHTGSEWINQIFLNIMNSFLNIMKSALIYLSSKFLSKFLQYYLNKQLENKKLQNDL